MLQARIDAIYRQNPESYTHQDLETFSEFKAGLNDGSVRAAEPDAGAASHGWRVNAWVKRGILVGFRMGKSVDMSEPGSRFRFVDKATYPPRDLRVEDGVRLVPGGSSLRDGCHIGRRVTCMPPMYVNVGAFIDDGSMVDSHALVGSCAQIGKNCHLSAAAQIGGVLEPVGALPVIIEDDVLVGGNTGVYEGTVVKRAAVLGAGTVLTRSTPVYDVVHGVVHRAGDDGPLVIPPCAVVVPGSRPITSGPGKDMGLSLYAPVIVKYRDERTEARVELESLLR